MSSRSHKGNSQAESQRGEEPHARSILGCERPPANRLHDEAVGLARSGRYDAAVRRFREAIDVDPSRAATWRGLAQAYVHEGHFCDAEACLAKVATLRPDSPTALLEWGRALRKLKASQRAMEVLAKAVALAPASAEAYIELGLAWAEAGRRAEAKDAYLRALQLRPEYPEALNNLGVLYQQTGALDDAAKCLRRSASLEPRASGTHNNLGVVLAEQRQFEQAIECYHRALAIDADYAIAWNNLGNALRTLGRHNEAIAALERAVALKADYAEAANNLAITHLQNGDAGRALHFYDRALLLRPDYPEAHMNRGLARLSLGQLVGGWADYEWRWHLKSLSDKRLPGVHWDGASLAGKRLVVRYEQGLGDTFQFVRYLGQLKERGATVIFEGKSETRALLARTPGIDHFLEKGSTFPAYDYWTCLLSLPGHLGTTLDNIPAPIPYVRGDPDLGARWKTLLAGLESFRVGIAWQGNPQHRGDRQRSVPLQQFAPLARVEGVRLVSLQRGFGSEQLASLGGAFDVETFADVGEDVDPFLRTAAILSNLDLVVTVDSAIAHLAGAMGVPVWVALPFAADWRWLRGRDDSPWYPSMRLFRQTRVGEWPEVFERMAIAVRQRLAGEPLDVRRDPAAARVKRIEGGRLVRQNRLDAGRVELEAAVAADPLDPDARHDLGVVVAKQGRPDQAIHHFRRALELRPDAAGTHANLGLAFLHNDQLEESLSHLRRAIALGGGTADVHNNLGIALGRLSRPAEAAAAYLRALFVKPDYAAAHYNLARALLLQCQFAEGWLEFEWRASCLSGCDRRFEQPRWAGQDLKGQTILLWAEQGWADSIQFARYARLVRRFNAGRILLQCPSALAPILSRSPDVDEVIAADAPSARTGPAPHRFDQHAPLLSVPAITGADSVDDIPAGDPYVFAAAGLTDAWKRRLAALPGTRVGIAWHGDPCDRMDRHRSIPVAAFEPLSRIEGVTLVSLQRNAPGEHSERTHCPFECHAFAAIDDDVDGLEQMAAILKNLDLVITADTMVAHLAGAMGVPTWVALPSAPDWRWLLGRSDSPWYPTVRLFRQRRPGDWAEVFDRVAGDLSARAATARAEPSERWAAQHRHGRRLLQRGQLVDAIEVLARAAADRPEVAAIQQDWGVALARAGRTDAAIACFCKALELEPAQVAYHANLLLALLHQGDYAAAVEAGQAAVAAAPSSHDVRSRLGTALVRMGRPAEAVEHLAAASGLRPTSAEARLALGDAQRAAGQLDAAEASYRGALRLQSDSFKARLELASLQAQRSRHADAVDALRLLATERPEDARVQAALGTSLLRLGMAGEAAAALQRAVYSRPCDTALRTLLAEALLLGGDLALGWLEYEWRLRPGGPTEGRQGRRRRRARQGAPSGRRWAGEPLAGRSLLVTAEPQPRDMLVFARFAALLRGRQIGRLVIEAQEELVPLLIASGHFDQVIGQGETGRPRCDFHIPAGSLPLALGFTGVGDVPTLPTLSASARALARARDRFGDVRRPCIGLALADDLDGSLRGHHQALRLRLGSLGLELCDLTPHRQALADEPLDAGISVGDNGRTLGWDNLAAATQTVDLVVATDPLAAQLAGTVGARTFLWPLTGTRDWQLRTQRQRRLFFYPSVSLFGQHAMAPRVAVMSDLLDALVVWQKAG